MAFNWKNIGRAALSGLSGLPLNLIVPSWRKDMLDEARGDIRGLTSWWRNDIKGEQDARDWELKMWNMNKQAAEEQWMKENEYNSYANQMSLAAQAGLNSHLVATQSAQAGQANVTSGTSNPIRGAQDLPSAIATAVGGIPDIIGRFIRVKQDIANLEKTQTENEFLRGHLTNRNDRGSTVNRYLSDWLGARNVLANANASMAEKRDAQYIAELALKQAVLAAQKENLTESARWLGARRNVQLPAQIGLWKSVQALNDARTDKVKQQYRIDHPKELESALYEDMLNFEPFQTLYQQEIGSRKRAQYEENLTRTERTQLDSALYRNYMYPTDPFNYRSQSISGAPHWLITTQTVIDDMISRIGEIVGIGNPLRRFKLDTKKFDFDKNYKRALYEQSERHWKQSPSIDRRYR